MMAYRTPGSKERGEKVRDIPDGFEQIAAAAAAWTAAKEAEVTAARRYRELIANAQISIEASPVAYPPYVKGKPTKLALLLIEDPKLDYQIADRIWGPGLSFTRAKNRISTLLWTLRKAGVVTTRGNNVHEINCDRLAEFSGIPVDRLKKS
ncbi:MAG: hypothetical protein IPM79_22245 [Polyangiaceae bacterium]|nr:hypothetical protein [Polyangiaceae bacterium]